MSETIIIDEVNSIEIQLSDRFDGPGSDGLTGYGRVCTVLIKIIGGRLILDLCISVD